MATAVSPVCVPNAACLHGCAGFETHSGFITRQQRVAVLPTKPDAVSNAKTQCSFNGLEQDFRDLYGAAKVCFALPPP